MVAIRLVVSGDSDEANGYRNLPSGALAPRALLFAFADVGDALGDPVPGSPFEAGRLHEEPRLEVLDEFVGPPVADDARREMPVAYLVGEVVVARLAEEGLGGRVPVHRPPDLVVEGEQVAVRPLDVLAPELELVQGRPLRLRRLRWLDPCHTITYTVYR